MSCSQLISFSVKYMRQTFVFCCQYEYLCDCITLFWSIIVLCGTDIVMFPTFILVMREYNVEYWRSHITLLWIRIMLWDSIPKDPKKIIQKSFWMWPLCASKALLWTWMYKGSSVFYDIYVGVVRQPFEGIKWDWS